jgi:hypothetical protein
LHDGLEEMNRRIRRRMVTRGDVSLDVEDNRGPYEWPQLNEIASDLLQFSVHLPLDPKQQSSWPGGEQESTAADGGAVRVLNIMVEECKVLSSRERCPFLIHVEVAETGLSGNDSRLYATGALGLGATIGEALGLSASMVGEQSTNSHQIPSELLESSYIPMQPAQKADAEIKSQPTVRGGQQSEEAMFYSHSPEDMWNSEAYENVRQNEYEQLHQQMYADQQAMQQQPIEEQR